MLAGSIERTLAVLAGGTVDIDQRDPAGITPLMMAACKGYSHIVKVLLETEANVSMVDDDGMAALHHYCCAHEDTSSPSSLTC